MPSELERELVEAMKLRASRREAPPGLAERVHRRNRRHRQRFTVLAAAATAIAVAGSTAAYRAVASYQSTAAGGPPAAVQAASQPTPSATDLCAIMPHHAATSEMDAVGSPHPRYPVPGLRVGYLPAAVRQAVPQEIGGSLGKGKGRWSNKSDWYWEYGWEWRTGGKETSPAVSVEVMCGAGATSIHTLRAAERTGVNPSWSVDPHPVTINGLLAYLGHGPARGSAYMFVKPGILIEVHAWRNDSQPDSGRQWNLRPILRGIHVSE